jgi:hypothetical protein
LGDFFHTKISGRPVKTATKEEETEEQIRVLSEAIKRYKKFRRNQLLYNRPDPDQQMLLASKKMSSQEQAGWNGRIGPQLGAGL